MLNVYIVHSRTVAPARRDAMLALCKKLPGPARVSFVDGYEPEELTPEVIRAVANLQKPGDPLFDGLLDNLHRRNLSNALKHYLALRHIADADPGGEQDHLVLEDDVVAGEGFGPALTAVRQRGDKRADITFLGLPAPAGAPAQGAPDFDVRAVYNVLPSCESYLVKAGAAAKLAAALLPVRFRTNVQLSYALRVVCPELSARATQPTVFMDGSKLGATVSTVEANNELIYNASFAALRKRLEEGPIALPEARAIAQRITSRHPDVQFRVGLVFLRAGDRQEARRRFEDVYAELKANNAVINSRSDFLKAYIDLHRPMTNNTWCDDDRAPLGPAPRCPAPAGNVARDIAKMQSEPARGASDSGAVYEPRDRLVEVVETTEPEVLFSNGTLRTRGEDEDVAHAEGAGGAPEEDDSAAPGWSSKFMYT
jgi:hypothetical protein